MPNTTDLQSAVSQICNLQALSQVEAVGFANRLPSATRRYSRVQLCATLKGPSDHGRLSLYGSWSRRRRRNAVGVSNFSRVDPYQQGRIATLRVIELGNKSRQLQQRAPSSLNNCSAKRGLALIVTFLGLLQACDPSYPTPFTRLQPQATNVTGVYVFPRICALNLAADGTFTATNIPPFMSPAPGVSPISCLVTASGTWSIERDISWGGEGCSAVAN